MMSPPPRIDFRGIARRNLGTARRLMGGADFELRYACLELRMAIEALAYDTLQNYADDVSDLLDQAHKEWQPKKVLQMLLEYDPISSTSLRMRAQPLGPDGEPKGEPYIHEITEHRLDVKWAAKAHGSLGSFLHQRTIAHINDGKEVDHDTMLREAERVAAELDRILASEVFGIRIATRFGYPCPACPAEISVALGPLMVFGKAKTRCTDCGGEWIATSDGSGTPKFTPIP
jgi:hypothetical protein